MELQLFRRFTNSKEIDEISKVLQGHSIEHSIVRPSSSHLGSSYGGYKESFYELYALEEDFETIKKLLEERADEVIENLDSDYHLFSYSNQELKDILSAPDGWSEVDVKLSAKILNDREEARKTGNTNIDLKPKQKFKFYPHVDHKKHPLRNYLKYYAFLLLTVLIGLALGLYKYIENPAGIQDNKTDTFILIGLVFINILYYQVQNSCPKCNEKLRTTLIDTMRAGDIMMPRHFNVLKKFRCENCGHLWDEYFKESEGD